MELYNWDVVALEIVDSPVTARDSVAEDHEDAGGLALEEREELFWLTEVCVCVCVCVCVHVCVYVCV